MEKVSRAEAVERFGNPTCVRFYRKYNHINEIDIKYQMIRSLFAHYEEVERGGRAEKSHFILRKKRPVRLAEHEVEWSQIFEVAAIKARNYPKEFYRKDIGSVYQAKNKYTGEVYIGSTLRPLTRRISEHKSYMSNPKSLNFNTKIARAMRTYGFDAFEWEILENSNDKDMLREAEDKWIEIFDSINKGLNENRSYRKKRIKSLDKISVNNN